MGGTRSSSRDLVWLFNAKVTGMSGWVQVLKELIHPDVVVVLFEAVLNQRSFSRKDPLKQLEVR